MTSNHENVKKQHFHTYSIEDWENKASTSLKDKGIESLNKKTYEAITLKPLYTKNDLDYLNLDQFPGTGTKIRGFVPVENKLNQWNITQRIYKKSWDEAKRLLFTAIENGQDSISLDVESLDKAEEIKFSDLELDFSKHPIFIMTKEHLELVLDRVIEIADQNPYGVIATDVISSHLSNGDIAITNQKKADNWAAQVQLASEKLPHIKTILIDTTPYHNGGANAIQELAIALAEATFYIEWMKTHKWSPEQTIKKLVFHFAIGGNFFMEIAKIRAFRVLWTTIEKAYNISVSQGVTISAETSCFTKSALDPFVNMLRSGNEAFAAILGGVEYLHVTPYDAIYQENNEFSARIARNTQLILREETHIDKVVDPAGGSYYIEALTNELVEKAWEFFQKIDGMGGIIDVLKTGWIQNQINQILNTRLLDVETRRQTIVGTNVYANPTENIPFMHSIKGDAEMNVIPIHAVRLSQAFEKLRERAYLLEKKGKTPVAGLICIGVLKDYKQRADFVSGVLAAGGIKTTSSESCESIEDIKTFIKESQFPYYCICGNNEAYSAYAESISKWVKENDPSIKVDIAGRFSEEEMEKFHKRGITDSVHFNQNIVGKLTSLLKLWEV